MFTDQLQFLVQENDGEQDGDMELSAQMFEAAMRQQVLLPYGRVLKALLLL
jgi:hypothetical protein